MTFTITDPSRYVTNPSRAEKLLPMISTRCDKRRDRLDRAPLTFLTRVFLLLIFNYP